ncbi:MAG: hypothetical protein AB7O96_04615, partial [Pseudobdellovibrionaceae bacterium]
SNAMVVTTINGKQTAYRDHTQGRATGWDQAAFKKIFPDLANGNQVDENQKILMSSRGGRLASSVLFSFVR